MSSNRLDPYVAALATKTKSNGTPRRVRQRFPSSCVRTQPNVNAVDAEISARNSGAKDAGHHEENRQFASAKAADSPKPPTSHASRHRDWPSPRFAFFKMSPKPRQPTLLCTKTSSVTDSTPGSPSSPAGADDYPAVDYFVALNEQWARRLRAAAEELHDLIDN